MMYISELSDNMKEVLLDMINQGLQTVFQFNLRAQIAKHPKCSAETLVILSEDDDNTVMNAVMCNPNTPERTIFDLIRRAKSFYSLLSCSHLTPEMIREILRFCPKSEHGLLARNVKTPEVVQVFLAEYAFSSDGSREDRIHVDGIHRTLVENENCCPRTLEILSDSKTYDVKFLVASHKNTSPDVLLKLARTGTPRIRKAVYDNPNRPTEALKYLNKCVVEDVLSG